MATILCACDATYGNTGTPNCISNQAYTGLEFFVPTFDSTGAKNKVNPTVLIDQAFLTARINDVDKTKRWYPIRDIKTVTKERADNVVEQFDDQSQNNVMDGVRSSTYFINKGTPEMKGAIDDFSCTSFGVLKVDANGSLIGDNGNDGFMYPAEIDNNSLQTKWIEPTPTTSQKIEVKYNYSAVLRDENICMINAADITANLLAAIGLVDVYSTITAITTTGFTAKLTTKFGSLANPIVDKGLVIAEFISSVTATPSRLRNATTSLDVTILTVTENPDGTYAFTFAAQGSGNTLILKPKRNGRDYTAVEEKTILIP